MEWNGEMLTRITRLVCALIASKAVVSGSGVSIIGRRIWVRGRELGKIGGIEPCRSHFADSDNFREGD